MKNKMKTRKAVAKRFKFTSSGKVKFKQPGLRHCLGFRSTDSKRSLTKDGFVQVKGDIRHIETNMPYGSV